MAGQSTSDAGSEDMIDAALREAFPEVDFQWICMDWGDGFDQQMTSRFAAGQMPDILIGKAQDEPVYQKLGAILPLPQEACEDIAPEAMELVTIEGEPYGLPYNVLYQGILYNREIFRELGLSVPEVTKVFLRLREMGLDVPVDVYTIPYAIDLLKRLKEQGVSRISGEGEGVSC